MVLTSCGNNWPQKEREKLYNECIESNKKELLESAELSEELCVCTMGEFTSEITWSEYQKMLKGDLDKDEKAFFNNKAQVVLDEIAKKCAPSVLDK